jgi:hypothetical protein
LSDPDKDWLSVLSTLLESRNWPVAKVYARTVEGCWQRAEALCRVAKAVAGEGDLQEARLIWSEAVAAAQEGEQSSSAQDSIDCSSVLWEIAADTAQVGFVKEAKSVVGRFANVSKRGRAFDCIAQIEERSAG